MQNTNIDTTVGNTSSIKNEAIKETSAIMPKLVSETNLYEIKKVRLGFFKRITIAFIKCISVLMPWKQKAVAPVAVVENNTIVLPEQKEEKPAEPILVKFEYIQKTVEPPAHPLRKLAEQQFMDMDTSQTTMN